MIEFLITAGISNETINLIKKNNSSNDLYNLYCNQDECLKIIDYLRKIGIKNIDKLLINEIQIFYNIASDVSQKITSGIVEEINNDYTFIENISI